MSEAADALYKTVKDYPGGAEALAARMGMNAQVLRNKVNPNTPTNHPTLCEFERMMDLTGDYQALHALARSSGHLLIKQQADASGGDVAVLEIIAAIWAGHGRVGDAVYETLADGRVEQHEVAKVKKNIYELQRSLIDLTIRLEGMVG